MKLRTTIFLVLLAIVIVFVYLRSYTREPLNPATEQVLVKETFTPPIYPNYDGKD